MVSWMKDLWAEIVDHLDLADDSYLGCLLDDENHLY